MGPPLKPLETLLIAVAVRGLKIIIPYVAIEEEAGGGEDEKRSKNMVEGVM